MNIITKYYYYYLKESCVRDPQNYASEHHIIIIVIINKPFINDICSLPRITVRSINAITNNAVYVTHKLR